MENFGQKIRKLGGNMAVDGKIILMSQFKGDYRRGIDW
jgi:hypothetical protein